MAFPDPFGAISMKFNDVFDTCLRIDKRTEYKSSIELINDMFRKSGSSIYRLVKLPSNCN